MLIIIIFHRNLVSLTVSTCQQFGAVINLFLTLNASQKSISDTEIEVSEGNEK